MRSIPVIDDATAQLEALADAGFTAAAASELEFFLYRDSYRVAHRKGYADLEPAD